VARELSPSEQQEKEGGQAEKSREYISLQARSAFLKRKKGDTKYRRKTKKAQR